MSYSFSVVAATLDEALTKVGEELDKVVASQPIHSADRDAAYAAAEAFAKFVEPEDGQEIVVSVNGSVSKYDSDNFTHASVGINVSRRAKEASA